MKPKPPKTAREVVQELREDPAWLARRMDRERTLQEVERKSADEQRPLIQELASHGIVVDSIWDLVKSKSHYDQVLPVLMDHLDRSYSPGIREGIARALAVPGAAPEWGRLASMYSTEDSPRVKDGLALAVAASATAKNAPALISLAQDARNGPSRVLLLRAIGRFGDLGKQALEKFEFDPDLEREARIVLRKLRTR